MKRNFPIRGFVKCNSYEQSYEVQRKLHTLGAVSGDWGWYNGAEKHSLIESNFIEWGPADDHSWIEERGKGYRKGDIVINWVVAEYDEAPEFTPEQVLNEFWSTELYEVY